MAMHNELLMVCYNYNSAIFCCYDAFEPGFGGGCRAVCECEQQAAVSESASRNGVSQYTHIPVT